MSIARLSVLAIGLLTLVSRATAVAGKRGLNYNNGTWANYFIGNPEVTWDYNWGWPSNGLDVSFEFVPMLWGIPNGVDADVSIFSILLSSSVTSYFWCSCKEEAQV
jgi:hypothetical protein